MGNPAKPPASLSIALSVGAFTAGCSAVLGIDGDYAMGPLGGAGGIPQDGGMSGGGTGATTAGGGGTSAGGTSAGGTTTTSTGGGTAGDCGDVCNCLGGNTCEFSCGTPPCDANCDEASTCTAECASATCNCDGASSCAFTCTEPSCRISCSEGSTCTLDCGALTAGSNECTIYFCWSHDDEICPDGRTTVCNAQCP